MNTSKNQSAQNPGNDQTTEETPRARYGVPKNSTAFEMLFETAAGHLHTDQLHYLARMGEEAKLQAESLSSGLMTLGCLINEAEPLTEPSQQSVAEILWGLSSRLDNIGGLIALAGNARDELGQREAKAGAK